MALTDTQRRHLRGLAHPLKPTVTVGQAGVTDGVIGELDATLRHHELVKVKLPAGDKTAKQALVERLCGATGAEAVMQIGRVAALFRANPRKKERIRLPA